MLYSARLSIRYETTKQSFSDRQLFREFTVLKPVLQDALKKLLQKAFIQFIQALIHGACDFPLLHKGLFTLILLID